MTVVFDKLKDLGRRLSGRETPMPFPDCLSIESSYACNLRCVMCPRHFDESLQGMFPLEMFRERVVPELHRFKYLHLTGWGEPLMNKDLVEMLRLAKQAGIWACFTTNGLLLKEPLSRKVLETGVDTINISCDASEPDIYEQVRGKGTFKVLMERMDHVNTLRREIDVPTRLEWTFVMMKTNLHQLPDAIRLAAAKNFERFTAKHMETAINREDLQNALWNTRIGPDLSPEWNEQFATTIAEARRVAQEVGIELVLHPRRFEIDGQCLVRPAMNIFIDYKGNVSACCYLNKLDVKPYIAPEKKPTEDGVLGSLQSQDFLTILESAQYELFRRQWQRNEVPKACYGCVNLNRMQTDE